MVFKSKEEAKDASSKPAVDAIVSMMPMAALAASLALARMEAYQKGFADGLKYRKKRVRK